MCYVVQRKPLMATDVIDVFPMTDLRELLLGEQDPFFAY